MIQLKKLTFCCLLVLFSQAAFSQVQEAEPKSMFYKSDHSEALSLNIGELRTLLLSGQESIVIALPLPNGQSANFTLIPDSIMADELASKYPHIKTFTGISLDNPNHTGRFDISPNGFHGMFYYHGERVFVEPASVFIQEKLGVKSQKTSRTFNDTNHPYNSYFSQHSPLTNQSTPKFLPPKKIAQQGATLAGSQVSRANKTAKASPVESTIKTYRIAISAAAEYTRFNGGTVDSAMAEIITLVNRLNQVYQHDLGIKLELVGNNELLVFTDANTDPFNNDDNDGAINTGIIDAIIGSANYDLGHIVNTDGGGLAVLGGVCNPSYKADGMTGSASPTNDAFYIDYVAHEIGHQFGANHTFNGTAGACLGNREADSAYEVGSGSTIMSYAGICEGQNLQSHSDAFFHAHSIEQISEYITNGTGNTCGTVTGEINKTPVVDAGVDYIIPARTPFKLSGSAEDLDSSNLNYSWQQFDLGDESSSLAEQIDDGSRPLFRAFLPSSDADRYFPKLADVLNNTTSIGESLPTTNRALNFRLMVFDHDGGVSFDEVKLNVLDTGQAFALNTPVLGDIWSANANNISWQVAQTNASPINCATVDVLLSKDGGDNFDISLASGVDNSGNTDISIDAFCANEINTSQARIKLVCPNNIFYAINNGAFSIDKTLKSADLTITSQQALSLVQGESLALTSSQFTYACAMADSITILTGENYTFSGATITPNSEFTGALSVNVTANKDNISSASFTVNITVEEKPEPIPEPPAAKSSGGIAWLLLFFVVLPWRIKRSSKVKCV